MATDLAGNQNLAADGLSVAYSDVAPTATITVTDSTLKSGQQATITIDWGLSLIHI